MYIAENSPIGSTVGELYAKDPDEGPNAIVQYSIIGNFKIYFIFLTVLYKFFKVVKYYVETNFVF